MTTSFDLIELKRVLGGLWGAQDPTDSTMAALKRGVHGEEAMLIAGELVTASDGKTFDNVNPATGQVIGAVADAGAADVDRAIDAARRAFDESSWPHDAEFRRHCLLQLHKAMAESADQFRATAVAEIGVAVRTTNTFHSDWPISSIPYWADMATNFEYEHTMPDRPWASGTRHVIRHEPIGVVAAITPWNFPLQTAMTKILPALAAGATVVLKPAFQTPWHATLLARLIAEKTDIPAGVINVVTPSDNAVAERLAVDPRVDLVHFTGSTAVGKKLMADASGRVARVALELGGKSANILLEDADFTQIVPQAAGVVCMNAGQGCVLPTRLLVPRSRYDEARELARITFEHMPFGDPTDPGIVQGPQISKVQQDRVLGLIAQGVAEGATLLIGGRIPDGFDGGFFVEPTLFADVDPHSTIAQREIFGPVLAMIPYDNVEHAIDIANNTSYGLAGYVWGDEDAAVTVARRIRSGMVAVNGGFFYGHDVPSGGYKESGLGRESGVEGFQEFLETKVIAVAG
ncbi:aldehyde dehydrogenase family protein [Mycolicibacterium smegmatis]|uniref:Aldehyde dehydrogenase (NAD) family protein n=1 Tax=Mycolicibacterium smegmatis (strain MKD8) TaxID=1214915 RepID=A0A2U9PST8_MYCSE|nr:aldehyde dehydrogenase family protein [Mycolicibacterium smegmatis]AWT54365.1 aldehyde dehydrogenase (NAD) family protein [Mycolicibacterium smegmatis MKD8]